MAMDSQTLVTASTYLNNLLLARGLLRNGKAVDFAKPTRETRAQIINLVHDLLLQRDRHEDSREYAADTIRQLRVDQERKDAELEKLRTRMADKERAWTQAQVEARNATADLKKVQASVKTLQTTLAKTKTLCEQIKTQCANDIRKRDLHIEKLKGHLQGQQRGNKSLIAAPSISISGGNGSRLAFNASIRSLADPEYSLKQESNEFLTQLSQSLCEENDGLLSLVHGTLEGLRELLGAENETIILNGEVSVKETEAPVHERVTAEMEALMTTLRSLLNNPNFVSVEEVDIRDDEIARLREGWEMMETRWQDVLLMMDGWRKRLEKTGDNINLEDLKKGLGLNAGMEELRQAISPIRPARQASRLPRPAARVIGTDAAETLSVAVSNDSGVGGMAEDVGDEQVATKSPQKHMEPPAFFDLRPEKTSGQQLRQLNQNFQSPRRVMFQDVDDESSIIDLPPSANVKRERGGSKASPTENYSLMLDARARFTRSRKRSPSPDMTATERSSKQRVQEAQLQSSSFLEEDVPQLTLEEKLKVAQSEADEARLKSVSPAVHADRGDESELELDMVASLRSPVKKSKIKGRPRRRKSTLNPEELASLLNLD